MEVCPVDCIYEAERLLVIAPDECIDCGACTPECPVEAIFPEQELPRRWQAFVAINYCSRRCRTSTSSRCIASARSSRRRSSSAWTGTSCGRTMPSTSRQVSLTR